MTLEGWSSAVAQNHARADRTGTASRPGQHLSARVRQASRVRASREQCACERVAVCVRESTECVSALERERPDASGTMSFVTGRGLLPISVTRCLSACVSDVSGACQVRVRRVRCVSALYRVCRARVCLVPNGPVPSIRRANDPGRSASVASADVDSDWTSVDDVSECSVPQ